ncbi:MULTISPECIES: hypothetical protein [unclassified Microcoleus]|nr:MULTISPECIES: hypothetical protein [unclassified Microcoleus]
MVESLKSSHLAISANRSQNIYEEIGAIDQNTELVKASVCFDVAD